VWVQGSVPNGTTLVPTVSGVLPPARGSFSVINKPSTLPHQRSCVRASASRIFQDPGGNLSAWLISIYLAYFEPGPIARRRPLISRTLARMASRKFTLSRVQPPCLKLPLRLPRGPPEPLAPPCMRQRARPVTAACLQG
jgi:hypothetical protein